MCLDAIGPRQSKGASRNSNSNADIVGSGRATLRLRSKGTAVVEEVCDFPSCFYPHWTLYSYLVQSVKTVIFIMI